MSSKTRTSRLVTQAADQKLYDGIQKHEKTLLSLLIGGASVTPGTILTTLQSRIDAAKAVVSTRATWQSAVKADIDERAKTKTFVSGLRQALKVAFEGSIETLADFGLTPPKPRVVSPEKKAAAAAKAKATRAARHTMGSKQKAQIKGTPATSPSGDVTKAPASAATASPTGAGAATIAATAPVTTPHS